MSNPKINPRTLSSRRSRNQYRDKGIPLPAAVVAAIVQAVCAAAILSGQGIDFTKRWQQGQIDIKTVLEGAIKILIRKRGPNGKRLYKFNEVPKAVVNRLHRDRIDPGSNHALAPWLHAEPKS